MALFGLFEKKHKLDLFRIKEQVTADGQAILLADTDFMPLKLMYITDDVMNGESLEIDKILSKHGYQNFDYQTFDGYIITGEIKGQHLIADKLFDFKEINGLDR